MKERNERLGETISLELYSCLMVAKYSTNSLAVKRDLIGMKVADGLSSKMTSDSGKYNCSRRNFEKENYSMRLQ